ncbi:TadE/TadG family type IV pilus assembly protein [Desulfobacter sp.]|uniref:TadE/TadG family type IV pilus assembly protein n=1 Tax=Desulfobacter sp. TaxID=2294 RepID=UPI003D0D464A
MKIMSESGVAAVEFALVSPVLILLFFVIIEFSIVLYDKAIITNASREGARSATVYNGDASDAAVKDLVDSYLSNHLISLGGNNSPSVNVTTTGDNLTVSVNYTYDFLVLPNFTSLDTSLNLSGTTVMRME